MRGAALIIALTSLASVATGHTRRCPGNLTLEALSTEVEAAFAQADVVAMVGAGPTEGGYRVIRVWKGQVGPTVFLNRGLLDNKPFVIFATRLEPLGPLALLPVDQCHIYREVIPAIVGKLFGDGYEPTNSRLEAPYSALSQAWFAGITFLALTFVSGLVWLVVAPKKALEQTLASRLTGARRLSGSRAAHLVVRRLSHDQE